MPTHKVGAYMTKDPLTVSPLSPLAEARKLMHEKKIRHLPVTEEGRLVGLLSQRDLQFIETLKTLDLDTCVVEDAMTRDPRTFSPEDPLDLVAASMAEHKYGSAVIVSGGKVVGLFTTVDALRALAAVTKE